MNEMFQPVVETVVNSLIGVLVLMVLAGYAKIKKKLDAWIEARTTAEQRQKLHLYAKEGMALAESAFKGLGGEKKLQEAEQYVLKHLKDIGLTLSSEEIRAAIEKAVLDHNAVSKK